MGRKLGWFVLLYVGGVGAVALLAAVIRGWIG